MSNDNPDTNMQPDTEKTSTATATQTSGQRSSRGGLALWLITVAAFGAGGGYLYWQEQQLLKHNSRFVEDVSTRLGQLERINQLESELLGLQNQYDVLKQQLKDQQESALTGFGQKLDKLQAQQSLLDQSVSQIHQVALRGERGWILAEADFLTRMALTRLHLAHDIDGAISALEGADARLHELADPGLIKLRQTYAQAIADLQATNRPDISGLSMMLEQMMQNIGSLTLAQRAPSASEIDTTPDSSESAPGWKEKIANQFSRIFTVRHQSRPIDSLPSLDEIKTIDQSLYTALLGANLALLKENQPQVQRYAKQAIDLLKQHYQNDDPQTLAMISNLDRLLASPIAPALPDISPCLEQLRAVRQAPNVSRSNSKP